MNRTIPCQDCNRSFSSKQAIKNHRGDKHPAKQKSQSYSCNKCRSTWFKSKGALYYHIRSYHQRRSSSNKIDPNDTRLLLPPQNVPTVIRKDRLYSEEEIQEKYREFREMQRER